MGKSLEGMIHLSFDEKLEILKEQHKKIITRPNEPDDDPRLYNGWAQRWKNPVLTADHIPLEWIYDLNQETNPDLLKRLGVNSAFNVGAIESNGKICLVARVEGYDRKSFFAIAESENGVDNFKFRDKPVVIPELDDPATNVYDMRLTKHEDGWVYGIFCVERPDPKAKKGDLSSAIAKAGVVRTKDMVTWERLPDIKSKYQQRNVVLHPEFVDGKYLLYTRPIAGFIKAGEGMGIGAAYVDDMEHAEIIDEIILDERAYHTIKEVKNGAGAPPIKTPEGWIHIAHGVRECAAGLRYVLYAFMTDLDDPTKVIYKPGGYFLAPQGDERTGDVSNVVFSSGVVAREDGRVYLYYGASDTITKVATTTVEKLIDYCKNTPRDPLFSFKCVEQRLELIEKNEKYKTRVIK